MRLCLLRPDPRRPPTAAAAGCSEQGKPTRLRNATVRGGAAQWPRSALPGDRNRAGHCSSSSATTLPSPLLNDVTLLEVLFGPRLCVVWLQLSNAGRGL